MQKKILNWIKDPEHIILVIILIAGIIYGIVQDILFVILKIYAFLYGAGLLIGCIFYLKDKLFNKDEDEFLENNEEPK